MMDFVCIFCSVDGLIEMLVWKPNRTQQQTSDKSNPLKTSDDQGVLYLHILYNQKCH